MQCQISIDDKMLEKFLGRTMTDEEFADFCKSAVMSKMFEWQFIEGGKDEMSEWHRGFYSAEIRAYKHAINYLKSQSGEG